jgi:arylsulfatase A
MKPLSIKCLAYLLAIVGCRTIEPGPRPTNVVVIFTDDMGYGDLGCYGHPDIATPNLDQLAAEGARFTNFYAAASVCTPSRAALLTGRYPIRSIPNNVGPESKHGMPLEEITIAEQLRDNGYRTMMVGKWHLGHAQPELLPTARGFEHFVGLPYSNDMLLPWCPWLSETDRLELYRDDQPVEWVDFEQEGLTELYTQEAVKFIEQASDEPFFLYVAHSMPHLPISASARFRGKSAAGLYGDVIECIDWSVGEVLQALEERGIADNTLVIFTSDNGPWHELPDRMLQRGVERWHTGSAGLLRGAKATTWEGGFRVPAIVRWPERVPAQQTVRTVATMMDLFPTIATAAGAPLPKDREMDGIDLAAQLTGKRRDTSSAGVNDRSFFYYQGKHLQAVRNGRWKLRIAADGELELFDLELDPSERYDRSATHEDTAAALYSKLQAFAAENGGRVSSLELAHSTE